MADVSEGGMREQPEDLGTGTETRVPLRYSPSWLERAEPYLLAAIGLGIGYAMYRLSPVLWP